MKVYDVLMRRRSVRHFEDQTVPGSIVEKLVAAANNAPSGCNIQPISLILVQEAEGRRALAEMVGDQPWVKNAPLSMVFCVDWYRAKTWASMFDSAFTADAFSLFLIAYADLMVAAQSVVILAESYGLGSVYVGRILESIEKARQHFEMPPHVIPLMVLTIGYPKSIPQNIPKLNQAVIVHQEKYHVPNDDEVRQAFEDKYGDFDENVDTYLERAFIEVIEADKQQDESWTEWAKEEMENLGVTNNAQFVFRLRYNTERMKKKNKDLITAMKNAGFDFFSAC